MALINCRECGSQMSDKAPNCPKCGAPNPYSPSFNPCAWHSCEPAVSSCVTCGRAMCKECADSAPFTLDNKPQCNECSLQMLSDNIASNIKTRIWSIIKLLFLLFFLSIGLMIYFSNPNDIMNAWIYAGIGGLPSALKTFVTRSAEEKWADEAMSRVDPGEGCFQQMMAFVIKLIFAFVFAPVAAIWFTVKNCIAIAKSSRAIKSDREDYNTIQARMQEMEHQHEGPTPYTEQPQTTAIPASAYAPVQSETPVQQVTPNQAPVTEVRPQATQSFQAPPATPSYQAPTSTKRSNSLVIGVVIGILVIAGLIAGYFMWYVPYAKDRDALRTYVVANNVFLRSSKEAGVEYNVLSKVPYGSELITYSKDTEWAEIKVNGVEGFVASPYLLEWEDFKLLNDAWGSTDTKEYIESSKCRLAILDYCKRNQLVTGNNGWQLYTLQKDVKPNNVLFPRLNNGYDKFTEFAFILKNNATQERRFAIYSFDEETEEPVFLYDEKAPEDGEIKNVKYIGSRNEYNVTYTGSNAVARTENKVVRPEETDTPQQTQDDNLLPPPPPSAPRVAELLEIVDDEPADVAASDIPAANTEDNSIHEVVEEMPEFPNGGGAGLMNFLSKNIEYPTVCKESGIQGKVIVSFVIDKDGSATDFRIVKSVNKYLDEEALRVLRKMPKWKPGKQKGVPVRVKYTVPINFRLS